MSEKRTYAYVVKPPRLTFVEDASEAETATISRHFAYCEDLIASGIGRLVGRTEGGEFGIVIFDAKGDSEAKEIADKDPAVSEGVFTAEVFPFRIALERVTASVL